MRRWVTRVTSVTRSRCDATAHLHSPYSVSTVTDADLVAASIAGNLDAFAELSRRHRGTYTRFAIRMVGSHDEAEDVLQLAFIRAYRALEQCREPSRFGAWVYQIVANECRTFVTRRARRDRHFVRDELHLNGAAMAPVVDARDTLEDVQYALDRIEADQREAFVMKYVEELSYEEMAEITGVGISALKMRVKRACARLRVLLEEVHDV